MFKKKKNPDSVQFLSRADKIKRMTSGIDQSEKRKQNQEESTSSSFDYIGKELDHLIGQTLILPILNVTEDGFQPSPSQPDGQLNLLPQKDSPPSNVQIVFPDAVQDASQPPFNSNVENTTLTLPAEDLVEPTAELVCSFNEIPLTEHASSSPDQASTSNIDEDASQPPFNSNVENTTLALPAEDLVEPTAELVCSFNEIPLTEHASPSPDQASTSDIDEDADDPIFENQGGSNEKTNKKRSRWHKRMPDEWARNVVKRRRYNCQQYHTKKGTMPAKKPKAVDCGKCRFKCGISYTNDERTTICKTYWGLADFRRQKDFILKFVKTGQPIRRKVDVQPEKQRKCSRMYYLPKEECEVRVCQRFFERTLCISNGPVNKAFSGSKNGSFIENDKRGKKSPYNKTSDDYLNGVRSHIESFPVMESHYCRKSSQKKYLDSKLSISKMFQLYKEKCQENGENSVSPAVYRRVFCTEYNLSFFIPRKDQCSLCNKYENFKKDGNMTEELEKQHSDHMKRKSDARLEKESDKERSNNDISFLSASFDLQSVLQIPSSEESLLYYTRKLCVYNLTVYEARHPNEAHCMLWMETDGKRGSNEIGTALKLWIDSLPENIKELSLFSDTCSGQNRNQYISSLFLHLTQTTHIEVIEQKFLESGHSQMEVDSMRSSIEHSKKFVSCFSINDWVNVMKMARSKRKRSTANPFHVKQISFKDILDLKLLAKETLKNRLKDEDGEPVMWLKIKSLRYEKAFPGQIKFRYGFNEPYKTLKVFGRGRPGKTANLQKCYKSILPISKEKKKDLVTLCDKDIIPRELHAWFKSLPCSNLIDTPGELACGEETEED